MKRITVALIIALVLLLAPSVVSAATGIEVVSRSGDGVWTDDTWQVQMFPGEEKATTLSLYNSSSSSLDVEVTVSPSSLDNGNLTFELDKSSFTMSGKSSADVTLSVRASGSATPGTYTTELEIKSELPPPSVGGGGGGGGPGDTTPPRISDILASGITETSADITWGTNEKSDSQVEYWSSPSEVSTLDTERVIYHHVHLSGLTPGTTYHYKTMSRDAAGNLAVSDVYTFTTLPGAAIFTSSRLSISPSEVYIGETVAITVLITNTGDGVGSYKVVLKINGVVEATMDITLNAGASKEVTFTAAKNVAGSHSVEVDGLKGSFTVKEKSAPPEEIPPEEAPPVKAPINYWPLIGGIIAGVVIVGLGVFFWMRRRAA